MDVSDPRILVVDDEEGMRELLDIVLAKRGYRVTAVGSGEDALAACERTDFDLVIQDIRMPGMGGVALLERLRHLRPDMPVVIITAYSTWDSAVETMRLGAQDYLRKPFLTDDVLKAVQRALDQQRMRARGLEVPLDEKGGLIVGASRAMRTLLGFIKQVAPTDSTVLIRGESGTGKELIARIIHCRSTRAAEPFISVNCGAFPETLLESELFGYMPGAFTGARVEKKGLMVLAHRGTLFLDEVGEMTPCTQVKLLRVLEERKVRPLGGISEIPFDARLIAATNRDMESSLTGGTFREDLYYRLNVIPLHIPPLRQRKEDIPLLAGHFLAKYSPRMGKDVRRLSAQAQDTLLRYDWPGNVRELENVIQRYVALSEGGVIDGIEIVRRGAAPGGPAPYDGEAHGVEFPDGGLDLEAVMSRRERVYVEAALHRTDGNMAQAAKLLGLSYRAMRYKIKKLGIRIQEIAPQH